MSASRLARVHHALQAHVERGDVPGAVALIWRRGQVHVETAGTTTLGGEPMRRER
jgi:hypothetical protein